MFCLKARQKLHSKLSLLTGFPPCCDGVGSVRPILPQAHLPRTIQSEIVSCKNRLPCPLTGNWQGRPRREAPASAAPEVDGRDTRRRTPRWSNRTSHKTSIVVGRKASLIAAFARAWVADVSAFNHAFRRWVGKGSVADPHLPQSCDGSRHGRLTLWPGLAARRT